MSPITFHPSLGAHRTINIPTHLLALSATSLSTGETQRSSTIELHFLATGLEGLNPTDRVELWTDAPPFEIGAQGGWRAVGFQRVDVDDAGVEGKSDEHGSEGDLDDFKGVPTIDLTDSDLTSHPPPPITSFTPTPTSPYLLANLRIPTHFPSTESYTFGYTYRITYPDGGIWWLGTEGGNGSVTVSVSVSGQGAGPPESNGVGEQGVIWDGDVGLGVECGDSGGRDWDGFVLDVEKNGEGGTDPRLIIRTITDDLYSDSARLAYLYPSNVPAIPAGLTPVLPTSVQSLVVLPSKGGTALHVTKSMGPTLSAIGPKTEHHDRGALVFLGSDITSLNNALASSSVLDKGNTLEIIRSTCGTAKHHLAFLSRPSPTARTTMGGAGYGQILVYASSGSSVNGVHHVGLHLPDDLWTGFTSGFGSAPTMNGKGKEVKLAVWSEKLRRAVLMDRNHHEGTFSAIGEGNKLCVDIPVRERVVQLELSSTDELVRAGHTPGWLREIIVPAMEADGLGNADGRKVEMELAPPLMTAVAKKTADDVVRFSESGSVEEHTEERHVHPSPDTAEEDRAGSIAFINTDTDTRPHEKQDIEQETDHHEPRELTTDARSLPEEQTSRTEMLNANAVPSADPGEEEACGLTGVIPAEDSNPREIVSDTEQDTGEDTAEITPADEGEPDPIVIQSSCTVIEPARESEEKQIISPVEVSPLALETGQEDEPVPKLGRNRGSASSIEREDARNFGEPDVILPTSVESPSSPSIPSSPDDELDGAESDFAPGVDRTESLIEVDDDEEEMVEEDEEIEADERDRAGLGSNVGEEDRLMPGHNTDTNASDARSLPTGHASTGTFWILFSFLHSFWINSGLSWLWYRISGGGRGAAIGNGGIDGLRDSSGPRGRIEDADVGEGIDDEDDWEETDGRERDESPERAQSGSGTNAAADENTPLLSGTSTLVNSPRQNVPPSFSVLGSSDGVDKSVGVATATRESVFG